MLIRELPADPASKFRCRASNKVLGSDSKYEVLPLMATGDKKGFFRAFLDFFILFSGISTASNLARTQGRPLLTRGMFLFRKPTNK